MMKRTKHRTVKVSKYARKIYVPMVHNLMGERGLHRSFRTATAANLYADQVSERFNRIQARMVVE